MYSSTLLFHEKLLPKMSISEKLFSCLTNSLVNITKDDGGEEEGGIYISWAEVQSEQAWA